MGLKGFLFSSHFIDGGVTGISMLLAVTTPLPLAVWLPVVNLPFVVLGYRQLGRAFALRSALAIIGLAIVLATVHFPDVTHDLLLTAVFGGVFIGAGIGLAMRGSAVLDGTEIAALLIGKRSAVLKVGDVILALQRRPVPRRDDGARHRAGALFDPDLRRRRAHARVHPARHRGVHRDHDHVGSASQAIREAILGEMGRGVTVYKAWGGKTGEDREILYCVVTRLEIGRVMRIIDGFDASAFVIQHPLADVRGGVVHRHALP